MRAAIRPRGFTLIELMITVTIVGVLATIAVIAYRKYSNSARKSEVYAMFAEIRAKEEAYRTEFSSYLSTSANEDTYYPVPNGAPQLWAPPAGSAWTQLGIDPGKNQVYCGYNVIAGGPGAWGAAGARGQTFVGALPTGQWWYASGSCDNDGNAAVNAVFTTASSNSAVLEQNPQR